MTLVSLFHNSFSVDNKWDGIRFRLGTVGGDGKPLSAITGEETEKELRALAVSFTGQCPAGRQHCQCPFRLLNAISYASLNNLLNGMNRESLLELFAMECECRTAAMDQPAVLEHGEAVA